MAHLCFQVVMVVECGARNTHQIKTLVYLTQELLYFH